jgi:NTP pyrophosphatase (non-canonical NTP hydrolase)
MLTFERLRAANAARQIEWGRSDQKIGLGFRAIELAGETGEACNIVKKLEREKLGLQGSRATTADLAAELADVAICADLTALSAGIDLGQAIVEKFDATSEAQGLATRLASSQPTPPPPTPPPPAPAEHVWQWWSGDNEDTYHGPFETRDEAIEEALERYGIDPNDWRDARKSIFVVEAAKEELRLGPFIDLATYVSDHLEDGGALAEYQGEEGDSITKDVTEAQWKDLQARFEALVDAWQADHNIKLIPWRFGQTRNHEEIFPAANAEPPSAEPQAPPTQNEVSS